MPNPNEVKVNDRKTVKPLLDHEPTARLLSELTTQSENPTLRLLYKESRHAARCTPNRNVREVIVSTAVSQVFAEHCARPMSDAELKTVVHRIVYREQHRMKKQCQPAVDRGTDNDDMDDPKIHGDIRVSPTRPDWKQANDSEDRMIARLDALKQFQSVLSREEIQSYTEYYGSRVTGTRHTPAVRQRMARIKRKLKSAGII
jgi:hypothetical protein